MSRGNRVAMPWIYLFPLFTSSAILIGTRAQDVKDYGSSGYDLERGPVFYEPADESASRYREKRYFDRGAVVEKSYQLAGNDFDRGYEPDASGRNYWTDDDSIRERGRADQRDSMALTRPYYADNLDTMNVRRKPAVAEPLGYRLRFNRLATFDEYGRRIDFGPPIGYQQAFPDGPTFYPAVEARGNQPGLSGSASGISSARLENSAVMGGGAISRNLDERTFLEGQAYRDSAKRPRNVLDAAQIYPGKMEAPMLIDERSSPSGNRYPLAENIFQPRPQIINYVFSKNRADPVPRTFEKNRVPSDKDDKDAKDTAEVASIRISEIPRHKTRHHHGEGPRRDYSNHRRS